MQVRFPFEEQKTQIFGVVRRPVADVLFWSKDLSDWFPVKMVVDTGADYTILPKWVAAKLGVNVKKDCRKFTTIGVGGRQNVYVVSGGWKVKLGEWEKIITLGFLGGNNIPPLLGRINCLELLKVTLENFTTRLEV